MSRQSWVQDVKRSVVKLSAVEREFNFEEPYKTGSDCGVCGSGFFVSQKLLFGKILFPGLRTVITNSHVVEGAPTKTCRMSFPDCGKSTLECTVAYICPEIDVAVVTVDGNAQSNWFEPESATTFLKRIPDLPCVEKRIIGMAEEVVAIGYPLDSDDCVATVGCISCRDEAMFKLAMSINDGNSGGCVCYDGKVLGVATSTAAEAEGIAFCIPILQIIKFFNQWLDGRPSGSLLQPPRFAVNPRVATHAFFEHAKISDATGVIADYVPKDGALHKAGVRDNDVITCITTTVNGKQYEFAIDNHGLINVPWSMSKIEFTNLDFVLFCNRSDTYVTYLSKNGKTYSPRKRKVPICTRRKRLDNRVPFWEPIPHILMGGIVFMDLCENHLQDMKRGRSPLDARVLLHLIETHADEHAVCIPYVFPQSIVDDTEAVNKFAIVTHVNGNPVKTVADCERELKRAVKKKFIRINTEQYDDIILKTENLRMQDVLFGQTVPGYPQKTLLTENSRARKVPRVPNTAKIMKRKASQGTRRSKRIKSMN